MVLVNGWNYSLDTECIKAQNYPSPLDMTLEFILMLIEVMLWIKKRILAVKTECHIGALYYSAQCADDHTSPEILLKVH